MERIAARLTSYWNGGHVAYERLLSNGIPARGATDRDMDRIMDRFQTRGVLVVASGVVTELVPCLRLRQHIEGPFTEIISFQSEISVG